LISLLKGNRARPLLGLIAFLFASNLAILLDVPVLRPLLGYFFLAIIPGLVILHLLKLNEIPLTEKFALSVALSTAFVLILGLIINIVYPLVGYETPLSTISVLVSFSVVLLILGVIGYFRNGAGSIVSWGELELSTHEKLYLLLPGFFPLLSILGMYFLNTENNNFVLIALLFIVIGYIIVISTLQSRVSSKIYPLLVYLIGISLILMLGLRSPHILGVDVNLEYYYFQLTTVAEKWQMVGGSLDSCLSVTLLPAAYQALLNINPEYLYKLLYPLLFSVVPLIVYLISRQFFGGYWSFIAAFFFISQLLFLDAAANPRTTLAILFFGAAIMVLFRKELGTFISSLFFMIFAFCCILSHYSTSYLFAIVLILTWVTTLLIRQPTLLRIIKQMTKYSTAQIKGGTTQHAKYATTLHKDKVAGGVPVSNRRVSFIIVFLFLSMIFLWYSQITERTFESGVHFIAEAVEGIPQFFERESRSKAITTLLGFGAQDKGFPHDFGIVCNWMSFALIAIGVSIIGAEHVKRTLYPHSTKLFLPSSCKKGNAEFFIICLICCTILVAAVAIPHFSAYGVNRTFTQMAVVLAPFFVIGGLMLAKVIRAKSASLATGILLLVLIPYFSLNTGLMHQVFGQPRSMTLNSKGAAYDLMYIYEQEVYACQWLNEYRGQQLIYGDATADGRLLSQGGVSPNSYRPLVDGLISGTKIKGYIFLRHYNLAEGRLSRTFTDDEYYLAQYADKFAVNSKVYANGGSEIWL